MSDIEGNPDCWFSVTRAKVIRCFSTIREHYLIKIQTVFAREDFYIDCTILHRALKSQPKMMPGHEKLCFMLHLSVSLVPC